MKARIEDLKKGDVILVASSKGLFEAKILRQPSLATQGKLTTWWGAPRWKSVLIAIREETTVRGYTSWNGKVTNYNYTKAVIADGKEYTREKRIDLSDADVWIIKRENL